MSHHDTRAAAIPVKFLSTKTAEEDQPDTGGAAAKRHKFTQA